jgi:hypothetical protein
MQEGKFAIKLMTKVPESGTWSSPDWTRTSNPSINSRMLCQLSYGGPSFSGPGYLTRAGRRVGVTVEG